MPFHYICHSLFMSSSAPGLSSKSPIALPLYQLLCLTWQKNHRQILARCEYYQKQNRDPSTRVGWLSHTEKKCRFFLTDSQELQLVAISS